MRDIIPNKSSIRGWYIRTRFIYTTNFGRISKPTSDIPKLEDIRLIGDKSEAHNKDKN